MLWNCLFLPEQNRNLFRHTPQTKGKKRNKHCRCRRRVISNIVFFVCHRQSSWQTNIICIVIFNASIIFIEEELFVVFEFYPFRTHSIGKKMVEDKSRFANLNLLLMPARYDKKEQEQLQKKSNNHWVTTHFNIEIL